MALLGIAFLYLPRPLPTTCGVNGISWWAPLGGLVGSLAVVCGLLFVDRIGPVHSPD